MTDERPTTGEPNECRQAHHAERLEEQEKAITTISAGQAALERKLTHDIEPKLDKTIEFIEGRPIRSLISNEVIGHSPGLASHVEAIEIEVKAGNETTRTLGTHIGELAKAINGGTAIRHQREWTQTQRWVAGILITLLGGILLTLIPIAIEIGRANL